MTQKATYFLSPRKLLVSLSKELSQREIQHANLQILGNLSRKKEKIKSLYLTKSHQIIQPSLQPTKSIYPEFTNITPIATDQPFISEKIKENILRPQRYYSKQPNMKVGSFSQEKRWRLPEKQIIVSRKFEEFSRIVDQQSASYKIEKLAKLMDQRISLFNDSTPKYTRMKKTYFSKFASDKYNFYNSTSKISIALDSPSLRKSRARVLNIEENYVDSKMEAAIKNPKFLKMSSERDSLTQVSKGKSKSTFAKSRVKTLRNQKNIESSG